MQSNALTDAFKLQVDFVCNQVLDCREMRNVHQHRPVNSASTAWKSLLLSEVPDRACQQERADRFLQALGQAFGDSRGSMPGRQPCVGVVDFSDGAAVLVLILQRV